MRNTYLVCYDISDDRRRERIFKTCRNYGIRLQYSVFECDLDPAELQNLQSELGGAISATDDQILFVSLGPTAGRGNRVISALGRPYTKLDSPCYVV